MCSVSRRCRFLRTYRNSRFKSTAALQTKSPIFPQRRNNICIMSNESKAQSPPFHSPPSMHVKLVRSSTARPLLYSKESKEMMQRIAYVIQDDHNPQQRSTKGLLPVEAAYSVFRRVTQAAGEPLMPVGMSTFNKLQSLRTDPALKVLRTQTWKSFFAESHDNNHDGGLRNTSRDRSPVGSRSSSPMAGAARRSGQQARPLSAPLGGSRRPVASSSSPAAAAAAVAHNGAADQHSQSRPLLSTDRQDAVLQAVLDGA